MDKDLRNIAEYYGLRNFARSAKLTILKKGEDMCVQSS